MAKRTQHVAPNNVAICCVGMLRSFAGALGQVPSFKFRQCEDYPEQSKPYFEPLTFAWQRCVLQREYYDFVCLYFH